MTTHLAVPVRWTGPDGREVGELERDPCRGSGRNRLPGISSTGIRSARRSRRRGSKRLAFIRGAPIRQSVGMTRGGHPGASTSMSRLDSAIRRLEAQRDCIAAAVARVAGYPGPVLEIGLGNGRTYDHLRELLPDREIFVFERRVSAHPDCTPPSEWLLLGDLGETLPRAGERLGAPACFTHADIGCGNAAIDAETAALLARWLPPLMAPGGVVLSDQPLSSVDLEGTPLPASVADGRYHSYRVTRNGGAARRMGTPPHR
jgi:hypothetical protein